MSATFRQQHVAMLLTYSGISFVSGAVNHGFFSGERSLWTAAGGILLFVLGSWLDHRNKEEPRETIVRTLFWGSLLSIGLGFFTGGLQHFPDSPDRSAWVVPLGFAISAVALLIHVPYRRSGNSNTIAYVAIVGLTVTAASLGAWQWLERHPPGVAHRDAQPSSIVATGLLAQVVTRTVEVRMLDTMRFEPGLVQVRAGETVRFVARNAGALEHELVIGSASEIKEHAALMRGGAAHSHPGGAAIKVAPGNTGELVVTFTEPAALTMACLLPGHLEAGMSGSVQVAAAAQAAGQEAVPGAATKRHDHGTHKH
ncbi:cupredoxin family protein [Ramlibacter sp. PS3R-8]|uniref:cupredoxin family protein n=1 Tax=Ramlibacter sp. PS3R-8 TaxID=3133437 RepID=UPI0030A9527F